MVTHTTKSLCVCAEDANDRHNVSVKTVTELISATL